LRADDGSILDAYAVEDGPASVIYANLWKGQTYVSAPSLICKPL